MTVQRMPGDRQSSQHRLTCRIWGEGDRSLLSEYTPTLSYQSFQAPGTPRSNLSETTGYYSTQSTSLPSVCSAAISPVTPDMKTSLSGFGRRPSPSINVKLPPSSNTSVSRHSGYETDQTSFESRFRASSGGSSCTQSFPGRHGDSLSYTTGYRPLYLGSSNGNSTRNRMSSQSSYGGSSQVSSAVSPKSEATSFKFCYSPRSVQSSSFSSTAQSYSVDRLESCPPRRMSGDRHVTSLSPHSMSLSNVYKIDARKRTNV